MLNRQRGRRIDRGRLAGFVQRLVLELPPRAADELGICLVSDRLMREYQLRYRGRTETTDVLAFRGECERLPDGRQHLGDIVISVAAAARQARAAGHSLDRELRVLALHGYLHLLGYDHEHDNGSMRGLERRLQARLLRAKARRGSGGGQ